MGCGTSSEKGDASNQSDMQPAAKPAAAKPAESKPDAKAAEPEPAAAAAAEPAAADEEKKVPEGDADYPPLGLSENVRKLPEWIQVGCGDKAYNCAEKNATFAPDGKTPDQMPDLSNHSNHMAEFLRDHPDVYDRLKDKVTSNGVTLAQCIKTGVDNPGHPHIKTVGMTAGDEESYEVFKELFDPVISARHGGYEYDAVQPTNLDIDQLLDIDIDPEGKYVLTTRVRTGRSIRGFKLPPVIAFEERRHLETLIVKALKNMDGDLHGDYFPLHGSKSFEAKPEGMSLEKEESLRNCGNLFQEPDSTLLLASGMGRHWPDGRGVFHNDDSNLFVWVGEEDHMRIVSMQGSRDKPTPEGKKIKEVVARFIRACDEVQKVLKAEGSDFMHNDHLGWVLTCPSNLGTGLRAGSLVQLPKLSSRKDFKDVCKAMGLQVRGTGGVDSASSGGTWDISNAARVGKGEVELCNIVIVGVAQLVRWESALDAGEDARVESEIDGVLNKNYPPHFLSEGVQKLPEWIQVGCGDKAYNCAEKNATFAPDGKTPDQMPDLSNHSNHMAEFLRDHPDVYDRLKDKVTPNGVTLAQCIKTGVDNPGHPHIKTVGMTAGDEESYEVFKELFDPVISARHGGYEYEAIQPTNLDISQLSDTDIDPEGKYVLTTRVRTGRSIRGFKLPPVISFDERRKLETLIVKALKNMDGDLHGDYFPLHGSHSFLAKPTGMSLEKEESLRKCGNLFQEPDSTLLLASGMGRHWPDGRGVFHNDDSNLFVWVGEEDHMRIVSMQGSRDGPTPEGKNIKEVVARFIRACDEVQKVLKAEGSDFMHNEHLGWVLTCPSNLGTGLRAGAMVQIPKLSSRDDFKDLCRKMGLQVRGTGGVDSASSGGTWDISNAARVGKGEVELCNIVIEGIAQLVKWETALDAGNDEEVETAIKEILEG